MRVLIIDLETTGCDFQKDQIVEIGMLECDSDTQTILSSYSQLQEPSCPMTPEASAITGLDEALLKGHQIQWRLVQEIMNRAELAIAHNMNFDRTFLQKQPELSLPQTMAWGCSLKHIDWHGKGKKQRGLTYLAADHGFINPFPHRAIFDCATTWRLVAPHLVELRQRSQEKEIRISAVHAPFAAKDKLKARGYWWVSEERVWQKVLLECDLDEERHFLSTEIYVGQKHAHHEAFL